MPCNYGLSSVRQRAEAKVMTLTKTDPVPDTRPMRSKKSLTLAGVALRTPYWVFTAGIAVIFLFPLVWTSISSVSPHPGTSQVRGWGFGNYESLQHYQAGIWRYILNSVY